MLPRTRGASMVLLSRAFRSTAHVHGHHRLAQICNSEYFFYSFFFHLNNVRLIPNISNVEVTIHVLVDTGSQMNEPELLRPVPLTSIQCVPRVWFCSYISTPEPKQGK